MSTKHEITLTRVPGENGTTVWEMSVGGKKYLPDGYPIIDLKHDSGPADFAFTIANPGAVKFMPYVENVSSPIYIWGEPGKPPKGVISHQIHSIDIKDNGARLEFKDKNKGMPRTLTYQLNFDGADPLDPVIQNGGGGGNFVEYSAMILYAAAAVFLIAAAFFGGKAYERKRGR